ncbi:MAG: AAA family ATPase [Acidimicrobiales bacterium]
MAPTNPFHYGTPVSGPQFTGRRTELDALMARMRDGINVVLVSPRRYGKTSLLQAATARLTAGRPTGAVVGVNLLRATSLARFAGLLTHGAYHLPGARWARTRQAVPEFLRRLRVSPSVTFDASGNPRFGFEGALVSADAAAVLAEVYALLAEESARRPAALVLDEFQALGRLGPDLADNLKGLADEHPSVSLVLAGSKRHMMERLVLDAEAPLFGLAQRIALGTIPDEDMLPYLRQRAAAGNKPMDDGTARYVLQLAGPVPNDIQHLAYDAFEAAGDRIDRATVDEGMARAVGHDAALFAEAVGRLSPGQARVLTAIATDPPAEPYSTAFARAAGLATGSSVRKALQPLLENDDVLERDGRLAVADPFLAAWLRGDG